VHVVPTSALHDGQGVKLSADPHGRAFGGTHADQRATGGQALSREPEGGDDLLGGVALVPAQARLGVDRPTQRHRVLVVLVQGAKRPSIRCAVQSSLMWVLCPFTQAAHFVRTG
jgi:hypothetical protein